LILLLLFFIFSLFFIDKIDLLILEAFASTSKFYRGLRAIFQRYTICWPLFNFKKPWNGKDVFWVFALYSLEGTVIFIFRLSKVVFSVSRSPPYNIIDILFWMLGVIIENVIKIMPVFMTHKYTLIPKVLIEIFSQFFYLLSLTKMSITKLVLLVILALSLQSKRVFYLAVINKWLRVKIY